MKNLLNLKGVKALDKNQTKKIKGGNSKTDCESGGGTYICVPTPIPLLPLVCACYCPNHDGNGGGGIR